MSDALPSFIKTGEDALDSLSRGNFLKLESGKPVNVVCLTGVEPPPGVPANGKNSIISFNQCTVWVDKEDLPEGMTFSPSFVVTDDKHDPCKVLGLEQRFKALMLVMVEGDESGQELILPMGASMWKQLVELEKAEGESIAGKIIRVNKTGEKLKTKYNITLTSRRMVIEGEPEVNLFEHVGTWKRDDVIKSLTQLGMWPPVGGDPAVNAAPKGKAAAKPAGKPTDPPKGPPAGGEETTDPGASGDYAEV